MIATSSRAQNRRGLTLVEMLVVVALTVLMMTIIAQIFQATTGAIQIARAYQEVEQDLRAVEGTIKRDLAGATAKMSPPLNPKDNLGYFEYGENEFADAQGEDSDDYLAFTTTYTDGNLFFGRYLPGPSGPPVIVGPDMRASTGPANNVTPKMITSDTAEVIYFLRNGNLYRRTFLVQPQLTLYHEYAFRPLGTSGGGSYQGVSVTNLPGISGLGRVGWQALNDVSMRPSETINSDDQAINMQGGRKYIPVPPGQLVYDYYYKDQSTGVTTRYESELRPIANTLGDLTNRQNRAFKPRFTDDYYTKVPDPNDSNVLGGILPYPDGNPDDFMGAFQGYNQNFDNQINDFTYATYPNLLGKRSISAYGVSMNEGLNSPSVPGSNLLSMVPFGYDTLSFPFVYPNAYSRSAAYQVPLAANLRPQGEIHGIALEFPNRVLDTNTPSPDNRFLPYWNHNSLAISAEDNLLTPDDEYFVATRIPSTNNSRINPQTSFLQTWWGFPTWREQLSLYWTDPLKRLNAPLNLAVGTWPKGVTQIPYGSQAFGLSWNPTTQPYGWLPEMVSPTRTMDQPFSEPIRNGMTLYTQPSGSDSLFLKNMSDFGIWNTTWEDDLLATNVRSFDVKVFEAMPEVQSYVDLGYLATPTGGTSIAPTGGSPFAPGQTTTFTNWLQGFGHEGRMPPLTSDYRLDAQYPFIPGVGPRYLGDDDAGVVRLRRVWDTWSTDYSAVDAKTLDPLTAPPFQPAPRPSYPAPYPAPLRGIQIQIRMTDPRQERVRTITIHQDFTTKL